MIDHKTNIISRSQLALTCALHFILTFLALTSILIGIQFLLGVTLVQNEYTLVITLALSLVLGGTIMKKVYNQRATASVFWFLLFLGVGGTLTWATGKIYDKSWDGMAYHQIAIHNMARGWNPAYEQIRDNPQPSKYFDRQINLSIWVNHYSKGMEQFAASMMAVTGNIESGKVFNLLLIIAAFFSTLKLLIRLNYFHWIWNLVIALVAAMNPITVNQLFSYYLDGAIGSCLLILITQLILLYTETNSKHQFATLWLVGCISVILINLKFTGLIYHIWIGAMFLGLLLYSRNYTLSKKLIAAMSVSAALAIFVAGYNPYVTNTLNNGHPFYPIAGENKVDAIKHMIPAPLKDHNTAERFLASTFSRCDNIGEGSKAGLHYKIPFTFSVYELKIFQSEGARLGGFGVLWSGIFLLSVLGAIVAIVSSKIEHRKYLVVILLAIVGSVVINPVSWWARFVPQLWLFPIVIIVALMVQQKIPRFQNAVRSVLLLMMLNTLILAGPYLYSVYTNTTNANKIFNQLKMRKDPVYVYTDIFSPNIVKLNYHNISYVKVDSYQQLPCSTPLQVLKMDLCIDDDPVVCKVSK